MAQDSKPSNPAENRAVDPSELMGPDGARAHGQDDADPAVPLTAPHDAQPGNDFLQSTHYGSLHVDPADAEAAPSEDDAAKPAGETNEASPPPAADTARDAAPEARAAGAPETLEDAPAARADLGPARAASHGGLVYDSDASGDETTPADAGAEGAAGQAADGDAANDGAAFDDTADLAAYTARAADESDDDGTADEPAPTDESDTSDDVSDDESDNTSDESDTPAAPVADPVEDAPEPPTAEEAAEEPADEPVEEPVDGGEDEPPAPPPNHAPTATEIAAQAAEEDAPFAYDASAHFADPDAGDALTFTLADGAPAWLSINPATGVVSGAPENADVGDADVTVVATDANGETAETSFALTVANVNDAPTVTAIADQLVAEDVSFPFDAGAHFTDVDAGDTLTYSLDGPAWLAIDPVTGELDGAPTNDDVGETPVIVTATDAAGESVSTAFTLTVANVNDAPTVTAVDALAATEDAAFAYDAGAHFADVDAGDALTFSLDGPAWLAIDPETGEISGVPTNDDVGPVSFTVTAADAAGETASTTIGLTVENVNDAPTVTAIGPQAAEEKSAFSYDAAAHFTDIDAGDALSFELDGPDWLTIDPETGALAGTPSADDLGEVEVTVTATDAVGESVSTTFALDVADANDAPSLSFDLPTQGLRASYFDVGHSLSELSEIDFDGAPDAQALVESLDHMAASTPFWEGGPDNYFAAKYEGALLVDEGGSYTFQLTSDDGSALYIDGELVLGHDGLHGTNSRTADVDLDAGAHDIEVRYFENGGSQTLRLSWSGPDTDDSMAVIDGDAYRPTLAENAAVIDELDAGAVITTISVADPDAGDTHTFAVSDDRFEVVDVDGAATLKLKDGESLTHEVDPELTVTVTVTDDRGLSASEDLVIQVDNVNTAPEVGMADLDSGLQVSYYNVGHSLSRLSDVDFDADPDATGVAATIDHMDQNDPFWDGGPDNYFAAKYEGAIDVEEGGSYTFQLTSDDGSALYIDGELVLGHDGLHSTNSRSASVDLDAGAHDIEVRYFENGGQQTLQLAWSGPDTDGDMIVADAFRQGVDELNAGQGHVTENEAGDLAAVLTVTDPDAGDSHTFAVDDARFEVIVEDGRALLKLKDGESLDHEAEPTVNVTVTATDEAGESGSETFQIAVDDVEDTVLVDVLGTRGHDTLVGTDADERFVGGRGNDVMQGGGGDDVYEYAADSNGFDVFDDGGTDNGVDRVVATEENVVIGVNGYNDGADHSVDGQTITNTGVDAFVGAGDTVVRDSNSSRTLDFSDTQLTGVAEVDARGGHDTVTASDSSDMAIRGGSGNDTLNAGDADVTWLYGEGNNGFDTLNNGAGDSVALAEGENVVIGVNGYDNGVDAFEGAGDTLIQDSNSSRTLDFSNTELTGIVEVDARGGHDVITVSNLSDMAIRGGSGNDTLNAGDTNVTWLYGEGNNGFDTFNNGGGDTIAQADGANVVIGVNGYENGVDAFEGAGDTLIQDSNSSRTLDFSNTELTGIVEVDARGGHDVITVSNLSDMAIRGGSGNDTLNAGDTNVTWLYGEGNNGFDTFNNGGGDTVALAEGENVVIGVNGYDNGVDAFEGAGDTVIQDSNSSRTLDFSNTELTGVVEVDARGGHDTVTASDLSDMTVRGGSGNDTLNAGDADVTWLYGEGNNGFDSFSNGAGESVALAEGENVVIGVNGYDNGVDAFEGAGDTVIQDSNSSRTLDFSNTELTGVVEVDARGGHDTVTASDLSDMAVRGGSGNDTLNAGDADVTWLYGEGDNGYDTFHNGAGDAIAQAEGENVVIGVNGYDNGVDAFEGAGGTVIRDANGSRTLDFSETAFDGVAEVDAGGGHDTVTLSNLSEMTYSGGDGSDLFEIGAISTDATVDGGAGWTDAIAVTADAMAEHGDWTLVVDGGDTFTAADGAGVFDLGDDAAGTLQFEDGLEVEFSGIEHLVV